MASASSCRGASQGVVLIWKAALYKIDKSWMAYCPVLLVGDFYIIASFSTFGRDVIGVVSVTTCAFRDL